MFRCEANVEQAGSVTFDGETIEGAPPLWCAAAAGKTSRQQQLQQVKQAVVQLKTAAAAKASCHFGSSCKLVKQAVMLAAAAAGKTNCHVISSCSKYKKLSAAAAAGKA